MKPIARAVKLMYIPHMDKEYLSPEEVASLFSVSLRTVYNWIKQKKIPAMKIGGVWRIRRSDIEPKQEAA